jgi:hypothetical protein
MRVLLLLLVLLAGTAVRADPSEATLTVLRERFLTLVEHLEEPSGLRAVVPIPELGLEQGDIVRTIDGQAATAWADAWMRSSVIHIELLRAGKPVTVRIVPKVGPNVASHERDQWATALARADIYLRQLTNKGAPSGVMFVTSTGLFGPDERAGDVIRKIDSKKISSMSDARSALQAAIKRPKIVLQMERVGNPFTVTVTFVAPPTPEPDSPQGLVLGIKKRSATTYEIPKALVDAFVLNPMSFLRAASVRPSVRDGMTNGYSIRSIEKGSLFAAVGVKDGDRIWKLNGVVLDSFPKAVEVHGRLAKLDKLEVDLVREDGTAIKLVLLIK